MRRILPVTRRHLVSSALGVAPASASFRLGAASRLATPDDRAQCTGIENVTVLSMAPEADPQPDMTVLIEGERIAAITPSAGFIVPDSCSTLDGTGKWLMPALTDMHVHFLSETIPDLEFTPEDILTPYLVNGVLQIVDMAATPETNVIRDAVVAGEIVAPRIASAAMIDGASAIRPGAREIASPDQARAVVADIAAEGFNFVKVYSRLEADVFAAVLSAAEELGIRVVGHLPGNRELSPAELIRPGMAMIAHAEELAWLAPEKSDAEIAAFTQLKLDNDVALTSTLYLNHQIAAQTRDPAMIADTEGLAYLHPIELMLWFEENPYFERNSPERIATLESIDNFNRRLVKAFVDAGVPVFAGTDASFVPGLAPGFSFHEELATLVDAGLSSIQALEAATVAPARWLGVLDDRGTLEVGKRANLVLLNADPLLDIRNTRQIDSVFLEGERFDRASLDNRLSALERLYAPFYPYFSPAGAEALALQQRPE